MLAPYLPEESFYRTNPNTDGEGWRFLPYLCCTNIVHEYLQRHDPRVFNTDQTDILHFLSEMAASHSHPFITSPPSGILHGMVAVQWSKKGKVPKGIVNRNCGFMIYTKDMFPQYTEVGYHNVRNKIWSNSCLSHTEIVTCSLHGTEYRVELYRRAGEKMRIKDFELAREVKVREVAQKPQETNSEQGRETQLMTKKPGRENGNKESMGAG